MQQILDNRLILRSLGAGVESDARDIAQFYVDVFADDGDDDLDMIETWANELIFGQHPTVTFDDVWVVVDPDHNDKIVSALLLIPQIWRYDDIEIKVGRVEIVATDKAYRNRGLIRELMTVAHNRSHELGHHMQAIAGIRHYYRRFGYAMAVDMGYGSQMPITSIPKLKTNQISRYTLRPANDNDIPNIECWQTYERRDGGLTTIHDWSYEINHRALKSPHRQHIYIIESADSQDVGFVTLVMDKYQPAIRVWNFIIGAQSSYLDTFDDVLRGLKYVADDFYQSLPQQTHPVEIRFDNSISSTVHQLVSRMNNGLIRDNLYSWYLRVGDIPAFIKHIKPILEHRLAGSGANRFTGELKISFYQLNGVIITFENGCITKVTEADMLQHDGDTAFPYDTFLSILFGYRTWREMVYTLPEIYANRKADILLDALFPKMRSQIGYGVG